eukprot:g1803.t1
MSRQRYCAILRFWGVVSLCVVVYCLALVYKKYLEVAPNGFVAFLRENPVNPSAICHYVDTSASDVCLELYPEGETGTLTTSQSDRSFLEPSDDNLLDMVDAGSCVYLPRWEEYFRRAIAWVVRSTAELALAITTTAQSISESPVVTSRKPCDILVPHETVNRNTISSISSSSSSSSSNSRTAAAYCLPAAVVIGAKKAGTSVLVGWLERHPKIRVPLFEQHFFDKYQVATWKSAYLRQSGFLLSPTELNQNVVTVEKTPSYLYRSEVTTRRMHRLMPSARLLVLLRDPVSRAYSGWQHNCRMRRYEENKKTGEVVRVYQGEGTATCTPLMFERYLTGPTTTTTSEDANRRLDELEIVQRGLYAKQLRSWTNAMDMHVHSSLFD